MTPEEVAALPEDKKAPLQQFLEFEGLGSKLEDWLARPRMGMLVSLDHSIYFHEPKRVRADEWMFSEIESPWSGDGRGVVMQRIYAQDGTLLASCMQEVSFLSSSLLTLVGVDANGWIFSGRCEIAAGWDGEDVQDLKVL